MASSANSRVATPCIGVCSTVFGDKVCRGCKRYNHEIVAWNSYDEEQKRAVVRRIEGLLTQILEDKVRVLDGALLRGSLAKYAIRVRDAAGEAGWLVDLLRAGASQIERPAEFGFEVLGRYRQLSMVELRDVIDRDFYALSQAHFERYFDSFKLGETGDQ